MFHAKANVNVNVNINVNVNVNVDVDSDVVGVGVGGAVHRRFAVGLIEQEYPSEPRPVEEQEIKIPDFSESATFRYGFNDYAFCDDCVPFGLD
jgi:hypothetical protein